MSRMPLPQLLLAAWLALGACGLVAEAQAQPNPLLGLSDPTRPPPGMSKAAGPGTAAVAASDAGSAASAPPPPPREPQLVLRLVRVDPASGRGMALINDQLLEPGARIEGWTLVGVNANEAILQGPRGRLRLSLTGDQVIERNPKSAQSRRGRKE